MSEDIKTEETAAPAAETETKAAPAAENSAPAATVAPAATSAPAASAPPSRPQRSEGDRPQRSDRPQRRDQRDNRNPRFKKKVCRFCFDKDAVIDYKKHEILERFITDRGKILPRRVTGTCAKHQRAIAREIKRARIVALLPFIEQ